MKGLYTIVITGPAGVAFSAAIDLEKRDNPQALAIDDEQLQALLIVTAMSAGAVDGELIKQMEGGRP